MVGCAGAGRVEDGQDVHCIARVHGHGALGVGRSQGGSHRTVEVGLAALGTRDRLALVSPPQPAAVAVRISEVGEGHRLVRQGGEHVCRVAAEQSHPRTGGTSQGRGGQVGGDAGLVSTEQEGVIVGRRGQGVDHR